MVAAERSGSGNKIYSNVSMCRTYDESDVGDVAAHGHLTLRNCHIFPYDWQGEREGRGGELK
jgi:hypothetical protein